jgi:hypothetical protein
MSGSPRRGYWLKDRNVAATNPLLIVEAFVDVRIMNGERILAFRLVFRGRH